MADQIVVTNPGNKSASFTPRRTGVFAPTVTGGSSVSLGGDVTYGQTLLSDESSLPPEEELKKRIDPRMLPFVDTKTGNVDVIGALKSGISVGVVGEVVGNDVARNIANPSQADIEQMFAEGKKSGSIEPNAVLKGYNNKDFTLEYEIPAGARVGGHPVDIEEPQPEQPAVSILPVGFVGPPAPNQLRAEDVFSQMKADASNNIPATAILQSYDPGTQQFGYEVPPEPKKPTGKVTAEFVGGKSISINVSPQVEGILDTVAGWMNIFKTAAEPTPKQIDDVSKDTRFSWMPAPMQNSLLRASNIAGTFLPEHEKTDNPKDFAIAAARDVASYTPVLWMVNWSRMTPQERIVSGVVDAVTLATLGLGSGIRAAKFQVSPVMRSAGTAGRAQIELKSATRALAGMGMGDARYAAASARAQSAAQASMKADRAFADVLQRTTSISKLQLIELEHTSGIKGLTSAVSGVQKASAGLEKAWFNAERGTRILRPGEKSGVNALGGTAEVAAAQVRLNKALETFGQKIQPRYKLPDAPQPIKDLVTESRKALSNQYTMDFFGKETVTVPKTEGGRLVGSSQVERWTYSNQGLPLGSKVKLEAAFPKLEVKELRGTDTRIPPQPLVPGETISPPQRVFTRAVVKTTEPFDYYGPRYGGKSGVLAKEAAEGASGSMKRASQMGGSATPLGERRAEESFLGGTLTPLSAEEGLPLRGGGGAVKPAISSGPAVYGGLSTALTQAERAAEKFSVPAIAAARGAGGSATALLTLVRVAGKAAAAKLSSGVVTEVTPVNSLEVVGVPASVFLPMTSPAIKEVYGAAMAKAYDKVIQGTAPLSMTTTRSGVQVVGVPSVAVEQATQQAIQLANLLAFRSATAAEIRAKVEAVTRTNLQNALGTQLANKTGTKTETKAATKAQTKVEAKIKAITKLATRIATTTKGRITERAKARIPFRLKIPWTENQLRTSVGAVGVPAGSVAWATGVVWKYIPKPWTAVKPLTLSGAPRGARNPTGTHPGTTLQVIGDPGARVPNLAIDQGVVDILVTDNAKKIAFSGNGEGTDVGQRDPSPTVGMSVKEIKMDNELTPEDEQMAADWMTPEETLPEETPAEPLPEEPAPVEDVAQEVQVAPRPQLRDYAAAAGMALGSMAKDAAQGALNAGHMIQTIMTKDGPVQVETAPQPQAEQDDELSDLFTVPQEEDNDMYTADLFEPPAEEDVGDLVGEEDMSDLLGMDEPLTPPPGRRIVKVIKRTRRSPPPSGMGGMR